LFSGESVAISSQHEDTLNDKEERFVLYLFAVVPKCSLKSDLSFCYRTAEQNVPQNLYFLAYVSGSFFQRLKPLFVSLIALRVSFSVTLAILSFFLVYFLFSFILLDFLVTTSLELY
jgi:Rps23 Pro-64 3,4-dihydroxylase Tpa1-like proline 4-hydroxylase